MKNVLLILSILILTSGCGCRWASRNCPAEIIRITDSVKVVQIHDTTFFDTIVQQLPDHIIRMQALAMIDEMGFVQMPETVVNDQYGNQVSVKIIHDTVYVKSELRDSLITISRTNIRKELRKEVFSNSEEKTIVEKLSFWQLLKSLFLGILILIAIIEIGMLVLDWRQSWIVKMIKKLQPVFNIISKFFIKK